MKQTSFLIVLMFFVVKLWAQSISGIVSDDLGQPLVCASVQILGTYSGTQTNADGRFSLKVKSNSAVILQINYLGFETFQTEAKPDSELKISMIKSEIMTDEVTIHAYRAGNSVPVAASELSNADISEQNTGKDVPYLLELTPSVVANSDAGAGVGYTTMRVRGTDMTRINVTLDGVPLNDPESHGVWWVDLPDYASSADNIQIQRGAGSSTNGAAAFGANINFKTNMLRKDSYAELNNSYGSFNTWKTTAKVGTGLINEHVTFDARLSKIHSDGFIDRARTDMESAFISAAYTDKKNLLRVNFTTGTEETYQAWSGVPKDLLETNRTYNPYTYENEIDFYVQRHAQLFYTREVSRNLNANIALHYTLGAGYYEQFKENQALADYGLADVSIKDSVISETNLIRRKWLDNNFYGMIYSFDYHAKNLNIILGGGYNEYDGNHFGKVIWAQNASNGQIGHEWYRNQGFKMDLNTYLKLNYELFSKLNLWADLQYRALHYTIEGLEEDALTLYFEQSYPFFNPKAGLSFEISENQQTYFSFAVANREPARTDIVAADPADLPQPETMHDYEFGYTLRANNLIFNANFYYMNYINQLVLTGEINNVGGYVSENVPKSYRAGAELSAEWKPCAHFSWEVNATFSQNKILNLTNYIDNWDTWGQETETFAETDISFSPAVVAANQFKFQIIKNLNLNLISKYVSRQYIDNSANTERALDAYLVNNLQIGYSFSVPKIKEIALSFGINNVLNAQYETNAWVYRYIYEGQEAADYGYFPQAGRHYVGSMSLRF